MSKIFKIFLNVTTCESLSNDVLKELVKQQPKFKRSLKARRSVIDAMLYYQ